MAENIFSTDYTDFRPLHSSRYGNSRVFVASNNGKKVIVKTLKAECADDASCKASLRQEYETTARLDNKFVRRAIDFVQIEGLGDCIIFEYIEGKSLAEHVRVGTLTEKQVKNILVEVCDGLQYAHRNGAVHCNLNPENIMVTSDGCRTKLIDFGVPETNPDADRELLIKEMEFVAPEIIKGEDVDLRADIYSLGKIMEFIGERNISRQYTSVATHCTQFSKEQRYDSISDVRSAITKGHPVTKIILLLIGLAAIGVLAYIYVPKIKASVEKERAERMAVDFAHEVENMQRELPDLREKYRLKSIDEPIAFDWTEDSLRYAQALTPFFGTYQERAIGVINNQKSAIKESRQQDFDKLLISEFKAATDSIATAMKANLPQMTDDKMLRFAQKWHQQMK